LSSAQADTCWSLLVMRAYLGQSLEPAIWQQNL